MTFSALAFALMFGGGVFVFTQLNTLAKPLTERIVSESLGVKVTIGSMNIVLQEKRVDVADVKISNPSGFSKPHAVTIDKVSVALKALAENKVDVQSIAVDGTNVFLEVQKNTTNLHALSGGIKGGQSEDPLKVIIRRFAMNGAVLHPSVTLIERADLKPFKVSPVVLTNIGVRENGIFARDAAAQIARALIKKFSQEGSKAGFYEGLSSDVLKEIGASQLDAVKIQIQEEVDKFGSELQKIFQPKEQTE